MLSGKLKLSIQLTQTTEPVSGSIWKQPQSYLIPAHSIIHTITAIYQQEWGCGSALVISNPHTVLQNLFCYSHFTAGETEAKVNRVLQQTRGLQQVFASKALFTLPWRF